MKLFFGTHPLCQKNTFWVYFTRFLSSIILHHFSIFPGCLAPRTIVHPDVVKWLFPLILYWYHRCFSGFAACVGDAAGTGGSIVCVFVRVRLWAVGFSSVCFCRCVFCALFLKFIFFLLLFPLPVRACVMLCLWSVMLSVCIKHFQEVLGVLEVAELGVWAACVYYCINVRVCVQEQYHKFWTVSRKFTRWQTAVRKTWTSSTACSRISTFTLC